MIKLPMHKAMDFLPDREEKLLSSVDK